MSRKPTWTRCSKGFERHGSGNFREASNGHVVGTCPFCSKTKLYIRTDEVVWDCKACGYKGNWYTFLRVVAKENAKSLKGRPMARLAADRELPPGAFRRWHMGWDGYQYTLPVEAPRHDGSGWFVTDIRCKQAGKKQVLATPGATIGLLGHRALKEARRGTTVYLCEGEWDAIALRWLLDSSGHRSAVVVALPGANVLKDAWVPYFKGMVVRCCYDADGPGERGELTAVRKLAGIAKAMEFCHWPTEVPVGFDVRDWVVHGGVELKDPKGSYKAFVQLFSPRPRQPDPTALAALGLDAPGGDGGPSDGGSGAGTGTGVKRRKGRGKRVSLDTLVNGYRRWLHMKTDDPLAVLFGTVLANQLIDGDPLWMFFVAPPGGMKSELLMSIHDAAPVYTVSTLSAAALCSGMLLAGGADPSLIPQLDGLNLVVKDFTTTLTCNPHERDAILGILRDAYDGEFEKQFGNMPRPRRYKSRFGILAGVTPTIDSYASISARLGERFLKFRFERDIDPIDEEERIRRAMSNVGDQKKMRAALRTVASEFLEGSLRYWKDRPLPKLPTEIATRIVPLAVLVANLRGQVDRDQYRPEMMRTRASREFGTRLAKQLSMLAQGIAMYRGRDEVGEDDYRVVCLVALGSVMDKVEEVIRAVWVEGDNCITSDITRRCRGMSPSTTARELDDLRIRGVLVRAGEGLHQFWSVAKFFRALVQRSEVFKFADQIQSLRVVRKLKNKGGLKRRSR